MNAASLHPLLHTQYFGRAARFLAQTDSTNRVAADLARSGCPEGLLVVGETQTAGRGRLSRTWFSPPGVNLYLSIVVRPTVTPERVPQLALVAGLGLVRALRDCGASLPIGVKWPNDVWLGGRKLAGILCEMDAVPGQTRHAVIGVGINVNVPAAAWPPELAESATSLLTWVGKPLDRVAVLARFLNELEPLYDLWLSAGLTPLLAEYERVAVLRPGQSVRFDAPDEQATGTVDGLEADGSLRLVLADGTRRSLAAGDVHLRPTSAPSALPGPQT